MKLRFRLHFGNGYSINGYCCLAYHQPKHTLRAEDSGDWVHTALTHAMWNAWLGYAKDLLLLYAEEMLVKNIVLLALCGAPRLGQVPTNAVRLVYGAAFPDGNHIFRPSEGILLFPELLF